MAAKQPMTKDDSKRIMSSQAKGGKDMSSGSFAATAQRFGDLDDNKKNRNMSATSGKDYAPRTQSSQATSGGEMSSGGFRTQSSAATATNENAKGPSGQSAFATSATSRA
ncbi:hypothetical protein E4U45_000186 [Claviceps purpurea]|nr:hypothetical protein E4U45_000186 [Claviceps purpurea]